MYLVAKPWYTLPKEKRRKWDMKSKKYIFLGYCDGSKGYRLIETGTKKIVNNVNCCRDVVFFENPKKLDT